MSDLSEISKLVEASNLRFEDVQKSINLRLDGLEMQEAKANRLHFATGEPTVDLTGIPTLRNAVEIKSYYSAKAVEAAEPDVSLADFVRGVARMKTSEVATKTLAIGTNSAGGYTVPFALQSGIMQALVPASSLLLAGVGVIPIGGAQTTTFAAIDTIPTAAWRLENGVVAESDPTFRAVVATPHSLAFMFKISRELLADGQNIEPTLRQVIAQAFAMELDRAGLLGSGIAPEPRGLINTPGIHAISNAVDGTVLAGYTNIWSAVEAILQVDGPMPTAAIMSPRSLVRLGALIDTLGQPIRLPEMLAPIRLISTSQIPNDLAAGASSDASEIFVGDFTNMSFAMRENVSIQVVDQLYAATGQIAFIGHVRADVIVRYPAAFAVVSGVR